MPLERYGIPGRRDAQTQTFPLSAVCGCAALDRIWWLFGSQLNDLRHPMLRSVSF